MATPSELRIKHLDNIETAVHQVREGWKAGKDAVLRDGFQMALRIEGDDEIGMLTMCVLLLATVGSDVEDADKDYEEPSHYLRELFDRLRRNVVETDVLREAESVLRSPPDTEGP